MIKRFKPYNSFLVIAVLVLAVSFVTDKHKSIDLHFHDTYIVLNYWHFLFLLTTLSVLIWLLYLPARNFLFSRALTWMHVILTFAAMASLIFILFFNASFANPKPTQFIDFNSRSHDNDHLLNLIAYSLVALIVGQCIFIANVVVGMIRRRK